MFNISDLMAPGSGVGPQSGGFAPTPAEALQQTLRQQSSQQLMEHAVRSDPRTIAMAGMLARGLAGNQATAQSVLNNTKTGQGIKDASALMMQSGLIPGGNPATLALQVQNMMSSQGFRVGGNMGGGGQLYGGGAITDQLSRMVFDRVRNNFYDSRTGTAKSSAGGLDMSQMSDAMGFMTSRGVFRGANIANTDYYNNAKDIAIARAAAVREGGQEDFVKELDALSSKGGKGFATHIDKAQMKKVNDLYSDFANTMRDAKEVFGDMGGNIGLLAQNAERLIGTSLSEHGAIEHMRSRVSGIRAVASAYGLDPKALTAQVVNTTDILKQNLFMKAMDDPRNREAYSEATLGATTARVASATVNSALASSVYSAADNQEFVRRQSDRGRYVRTFSQEQILTSKAGLTAALMGEQTTRNDYALVAASMIDSGLLKGKGADEVNALLKTWSKTGEQGATKELNLKMRETLIANGLNPDEILKNKSIEEIQGSMSLSGLTQHTERLQSQASARSINTLTKMSAEGTDRGLFKDKKNKDNMFTLLTTLDAKAMSELPDVFNTDGSIDADKLNKLYKDNAGISEHISKDKMTEMLTGLAAAGRPGDNIAETLGNVIAYQKSDSKSAGDDSAMALKAGKKRAAQSYFESIRMGGEKLTAEDFSMQLMRGFFGKGEVSDKSVLQYYNDSGMKEGGVSLALNKDRSGLNVKEGDMDRLEKTVGKDRMAKLYKNLGVKPGDAAALAAALNGDKGLEELQKITDGAAVSTTGTPGENNNKFNIVGAEATDKIRKELETKAIKDQASAIMGDSYASGAKLDTDLDVSDFSAKLKNDLLDDPNKVRDIVLGGYATDFKDSKSLAFAQVAGKSEELQTALANKEQELRDGAKHWYGTDEDKIKEANKYAAMRNQIAGNGGGKFMGILEVVGGERIQINVSEAK